MVQKIKNKIFWPKNLKERDFSRPNMVKKWLSQKILVENFFGRNRFRMFQNVF